MKFIMNRKIIDVKIWCQDSEVEVKKNAVPTNYLHRLHVYTEAA